MRDITRRSSRGFGTWLVVLTACGGAGSDGRPGGDAGRANVFDAQAVSTTLGQAACEAVQRCYPASFAQTGETLAACAAQQRDILGGDFTTDLLADSIRAGRVAFHQELVDACVEELRSFDCDLVRPFERPDSACSRFLVGQQAAGATCATDLECSSGNYCAQAAGAACGKCAPVAAAGADCAATAGRCAVGYQCVASVGSSSAAAELRCASAGQGAPEGGACGGDSGGCQGDLVCVGAAVVGTCQRPVAQAGAACDPINAAHPDCARGHGLVCADGVCQPLSWVGAGATCDATHTCSGASHCPVPPLQASASQACVTGAAPACDPIRGCVCPSGTYASELGDQCLPSRPAGSACAHARECASPALCIQGTCTMPSYPTCDRAGP